jgi:hypothetical protein
MAQRTYWKRTLTSDLSRSGWCYLVGTRSPTMEALGTFLGRVVPAGRGSRILRPRRTAEAHPGTFSAVFGYGAQPFHTDAAHWAEPPRYVILRALAPSSTGTDVIDLERPSLADIRRRMAVSAWHVKGGPYAFAASGASPMNGKTLFRFDPMCMRPINSAACSLITAFAPDRTLRCVSTVRWSDGGTLVLDNWRVVHRRRQVNARVMARIYVEV